jgi:hypothetical protein
MSVIGPGSLGAINLAGSVAGGVRTSGAETDRMQETGAQRTTESNVKALASRSLEDIGETDQSADRDADGRMPLGYSDAEETTEPLPLGDDNRPRDRHKHARAIDADGVRGRRLDLEA